MSWSSAASAVCIPREPRINPRVPPQTCQGVPWCLVINSHALGRLLQRTDFKTDPVVAMIEAHKALLAAPAGVAQTMVDEVDSAVPAAGSAFLITVRLLDHDGEAVALLTADT